jgi:hypothetical protein
MLFVNKVKNTEQWTQVHCLGGVGGGDLMTAAGMIKTHTDDCRDATYIRVCAQLLLQFLQSG